MINRERRFWIGAGIVTVEMLGTLAVFTAVVSGIIFLIRPRIRKYKRVDLAVFEKKEPHINERNNEIMLSLTKLDKHQFLRPANLSLIRFYLFIRKHSWFSIRVASIALSSLGLMYAMKYLFKRKRPLDPLLEKQIVNILQIVLIKHPVLVGCLSNALFKKAGEMLRIFKA